MKTAYIIDTSILMDHPAIIKELGEEWGAHIYILDSVASELEKIKNNRKGLRNPEAEKKADNAIKALKRIIKFGKKHPINKTKDSYLLIAEYNGNFNKMASKADNDIIGFALEMQKQQTNDEVLILTEDGSLRLRAMIEKVWAANYPLTLYDHIRIASNKATEKEAKSAWRALLHKYHPDKLQHLNLSETEKNYAKDKYALISDVFEQLQKNGFRNQRFTRTKSNGSNANTHTKYSSAKPANNEEAFQKYFKAFKKKHKLKFGTPETLKTKVKNVITALALILTFVILVIPLDVVFKNKAATEQKEKRASQKAKNNAITKKSPDARKASLSTEKPFDVVEANPFPKKSPWAEKDDDGMWSTNALWDAYDRAARNQRDYNVLAKTATFICNTNADDCYRIAKEAMQELKFDIKVEGSNFLEIKKPMPEPDQLFSGYFSVIEKYKNKPMKSFIATTYFSKPGKLIECDYAYAIAINANVIQIEENKTEIFAYIYPAKDFGCNPYSVRVTYVMRAEVENFIEKFQTKVKEKSGKGDPHKVEEKAPIKQKEDEYAQY